MSPRHNEERRKEDTAHIHDGYQVLDVVLGEKYHEEIERGNEGLPWDERRAPAQHERSTRESAIHIKRMGHVCSVLVCDVKGALL